MFESYQELILASCLCCSVEPHPLKLRHNQVCTELVVTVPLAIEHPAELQKQFAQYAKIKRLWL